MASVVPAEATEEISVSRAACADDTMLDRTSGIPVAVALGRAFVAETPPSEVVIPMGNGMMGVVELSVEAVPVTEGSVDSPVVVAKRGKASVEEDAIAVALLPSVCSGRSVAVLVAWMLDSSPVAEAGVSVEVVEEPPFRKVERPTMMPPSVFELEA